MNGRNVAVAAPMSLVLTRGLIEMKEGQAQTLKTYPSMAPLHQYLMPDRDAEIALARCAAPDAISGETEGTVAPAM